MNKSKVAAQSRVRLDQRFIQLRPVTRYQPPLRGWIKAIRAALGMTAEQLAKKLGVTQPSVAAMEKSEVNATIELATLQRVAEALDCTLIYALVPNKPLETVVRNKAKAFARRRRGPVEHSMLLEHQEVASQSATAKQIEEIVRETNPRLFWD